MSAFDVFHWRCCCPRQFILGLLLCLSGNLALADTYGGIEFPHGKESFADEVIAFEPLYGGGPAPYEEPGNPATRVDPYEALGPPQLAFDRDVALGNGGRITLRFADNVLTGSGTPDADLHVFELGSDVEDTFVEISPDGVEWFDVGKVFGSTSSIDIDEFGFGPDDLFYYVRLTDDPREGGASGPVVGADIDAVGAISTKVMNDR